MRFQLAALRRLFAQGRTRELMIGDNKAGALVALDMEGRVYAVLNGEIMNWVNPDAYLAPRPHDKYHVPGGDGLWAAPEGTSLGYFYSTGVWRVPAGIRNLRYDIVEQTLKSAAIRAEVDLVSNAGIGVNATFERRISVDGESNAVTTRIEERIIYTGRESIERNRCLLAPWSLAPVPHGPKCEVIFPQTEPSSVRDLGNPSDSQRYIENGLWHTHTDGSTQYQIGIDEQVEWVEFIDPICGLRVRRTVHSIPAEQKYFDIADVPPSQKPNPNGVRLSIYVDGARGFTELEAAGGCPEQLTPGTVLTLSTSTRYALHATN